jgi:hypothetical protein
MGLRVMLEASGSSCDTAKFDDFCICRTTYEQGALWCCGPAAAVVPPTGSATNGRGGGGTAFLAVLAGALAVAVGVLVFRDYQRTRVQHYSIQANDDDWDDAVPHAGEVDDDTDMLVTDN